MAQTTSSKALGEVITARVMLSPPLLFLQLPKTSQTPLADSMARRPPRPRCLHGPHLPSRYELHAPFPPTNSDSLWQLPIIRLLYSGRAGVAIFFVISGFALSYKPLKLIRHHRAIKSGLVARIDPGDSAESARGNVLAVMGSSLLRRGIRLFVPVVAGTFIAAILAYLDAFTPTPLRNEVVPAHFPTLSLQLRDWWSDFEDLMFPFRELNPNHLKISRYNGHLWTIPLEFYGSMAVFLGVLGLSGAKPLVRMGLLLGVGAWGLVRGRWDVWLFLTGVVLAEWSLILEEGEFHEEAGDEVEVEVEISEEERKASWGRWADVWQDSLPLPSQLSLPRRESQQHHHHQQQQQQHQQHRPLSRISSKILLEAQQHVSSPIPSSPKPFISILNLTLLLLSLYILSYPGDSPTPGPYHAPLLPWTPLLWDSLFLGREHYWHALSAPLLLLALANSRACQRPFTTSLAQYLGSISYSLYITHGLVLFTLGTGLQERWTGQVGVQTWKDNGFGALMETQARPDMGPRGTEMYSHAFAVTSCVCGVLCVWAADVFWRGVDGRVVLWGRKIERLLS
ncbi:hypothetical protein LZ554_001793 [Drepanopeziza brunnea f. sp. 'monogermtubi']|nr:hypothetical protein LZ554_001793 [Drepanopeziza brunnea f. sp. 'monogermtubi']